MKLRDIGSLIWTAAKNLLEDKGLQLSAALSYYAALSLAPLLLLLLAVIGAILGRDAVGTELVNQMRELVGETGAEIATTVIQQTNEPKSGFLAGVIGVLVLLVGASGVFLQLQEAMNTIWEVKPAPRAAVWGFLRKRLLSMGMLMAIAFLLLVSLAVSAALAALSSRVSDMMPGAEIVCRIVHVVSSIGLFTALFAAIFKYLPDAVIAWRDVWIGAAATALLFALGKLLIGLYLGHSAVGSAYGAAGSIVVVLVWVYYSSLILFLGAEFTQVYTERFGSGIQRAVPARPSPESRDTGSHMKR